MRIAVNTRFLIKDKLEGIGLYTLEIIKRMVEHYPQNDYIFIFDRPYSSEFIFHEKIIPVIVNPPARHPFLWYLWFEHSIPRILKKYKADIFFSPDGFCSLHTTIPQFMVSHDLAFEHFPNFVPYFTRKYYTHFSPKQHQVAKHIFAVSLATKQDIIQQYNIDSQKISLAYNGCRDEFKKLGDTEKGQVRKEYSKGKPYFLCVGALHPRKNIAGLIRGFDLFKQKMVTDYTLLLVGRKAWHTTEIERAFENAIHREDIHFIPYTQVNELAKITASAEACICASFLEGFGVPVLEALNCRVPVLISNQFSLPEVAGPGAILFDPYSIQSIAKSFEEFIQIPNKEALISQTEHHIQKFSWDKSMHIIYSKLIEDS